MTTLWEVKSVEMVDEDNDVKYTLTKSESKDKKEKSLYVKIWRKKKGTWQYESGTYLDIDALRYLIK